MWVGNINDSLYKCNNIIQINGQDVLREPRQTANIIAPPADAHLAGGEQIESTIVKQWHTFIRLLRIIGSYPVVLNRNSNSHVVNVEFKLFSWIALYSIILGFIKISLCLAYYKNWGVSLLGRSYENTVEDWIVRSMNVALPLYQLWDLITIWITAKGSAKLCNDWIKFEVKFCQVFSRQYTSNIQKWRRVMLMLVFIPVTFLGTMFVWEVVLYFRKTKIHENSSFKDFMYSDILRFLPTPFFVFNLAVEDIKVLLVYKTLSEAYENLRNGIAAEIDSWASSNGLIAEDRVSKWTFMLLNIRNQVKATGDLQTLQQIAVLIHTIVISTETLFIFIKATTVGNISKHVILCTGICLLYIFRLISKVLMAETITAEEQKIADTLLGADVSKFGFLAKMEAKKIVDLIHQKPMKISLSGYISMEKRMIPKITSYVVAYLVVLLQFQLSNAFKDDHGSKALLFTPNHNEAYHS